MGEEIYKLNPEFYEGMGVVVWQQNLK